MHLLIRTTLSNIPNFWTSGFSIPHKSFDPCSGQRHRQQPKALTLQGCVQQKGSNWPLRVSVRPTLASVHIVGLCSPPLTTTLAYHGPLLTTTTWAKSPRKLHSDANLRPQRLLHSCQRTPAKQNNNQRKTLNESRSINIYLESSELYEQTLKMVALSWPAGCWVLCPQEQEHAVAPVIQVSQTQKG